MGTFVRRTAQKQIGKIKMIQDLFIYLFSGLVALGGLGVVFFSHPVHSVLCLIFSFITSAGIYVLLGAEFIALSSLIVYVGAVAVLLIFVVMSVSRPDSSVFLQKIKKYRFALLVLFCIIVFELIALLFAKPVDQKVVEFVSFSVKDIGRVFYTQYALILQLCGVVLLVSMIAAVILTFQTRRHKQVKRQVPFDQIECDPNEILTLKKVDFRKGIK